MTGLRSRIAVMLAAAMLAACSSSAPATSPAALARQTAAPTAPAAGTSALPASTESPTATPAPAATPAPPTPTPNPPTPVPKPPQSLKPGQTPLPSPIDIGALLTANVSVLSLGDLPIDIAVTLIDPDSGQSTEVATLTLQTLDGDTEPILPGIYAVAFKRQGETKALTCTLHVTDGEAYDFVTTDKTVAVTRNQTPAATAAELIAGTSSLCKP